MKRARFHRLPRFHRLKRVVSGQWSVVLFIHIYYLAHILHKIYNSRNMPKTITSTELQKQTREAIDYARIERDAVIVETYGRPMAVLLSYEEYQAYMGYKANQDARAERFARLREAASQNAAYNQLSEEEGMQLVERERQLLADEKSSGR